MLVFVVLIAMVVFSSAIYYTVCPLIGYLLFGVHVCGCGCVFKCVNLN
jgi:hypothetical protein